VWNIRIRLDLSRRKNKSIIIHNTFIYEDFSQVPYLSKVFIKGVRELNRKGYKCEKAVAQRLGFFMEADPAGLAYRMGGNSRGPQREPSEPQPEAEGKRGETSRRNPLNLKESAPSKEELNQVWRILLPRNFKNLPHQPILYLKT